jgi:hypothetical protein
MGKYSSLYKDIYSIFGTTEWKGENIQTFPSNFVGNSNGGSEYLRIHILPTSIQMAKYPLSVAGQVIIDIFTGAGTGTLRTSQIADRLDTYLAGKYIGKVQFGSSTLDVIGIDEDDTTLFRSNYVISFNYYEV